MVTLTIFQEFLPGRTTGKEVERITFRTYKEAFAYCLAEREKKWDKMRAKLGWWEKEDKKVALPYRDGFRRWAVITK